MSLKWMNFSSGGGGEVDGPGAATVSAIPRWGNAGGTLLLNSGILIDDNNNIFMNTLGGGETTVALQMLTEYNLIADADSELITNKTENGFDYGIEVFSPTEADFDFASFILVQNNIISMDAQTGDGNGNGNPTKNVIFQIGPDGPTPILITDGNGIGMKYLGNYAGHANITARSIMDKGYIDGLVGGGADVFFVTGTGQTVEIPSANIAVANSFFVIKDADGGASADPVTITTEGAETIDGLASVQIVADYGSMRLVSDGTNLFSY